MAQPCSAWTRPFPSTGLRDHDPPYRLWPVGQLLKLLSQSRQPLRQSPRLDLIERHAIHARRAVIGLRQRPRMGQDAGPIDLVVESVEAEARLRPLLLQEEWAFA